MTSTNGANVSDADPASHYEISEARRRQALAEAGDPVSAEKAHEMAATARAALRRARLNIQPGFDPSRRSRVDGDG